MPPRNILTRQTDITSMLRWCRENRIEPKGHPLVWHECLPLHFTELTITSAKGEELQAQQVKECYRILFSHPAVQAVTGWHLSDLGAWRSAPAGLLREDMKPKKAYDILYNLVNKEWRTGPLILKTDENGQAVFRGFLGEYTMIAGNTTNTITLVCKGQTNIVLRSCIQAL